MLQNREEDSTKRVDGVERSLNATSWDIVEPQKMETETPRWS